MRVWLAGLRGSDRRTLAAYQQWRRGTEWPTQQRLNALGSFTAMRREAEAANAASVRAGAKAVPVEMLARGDELIAARKARTVADRDVRLTAARIADAGASRPASASAPNFADALAAVLAGPHAEAQPPKQ